MFTKVICKIFQKINPHYEYCGKYASWQEAQAHSSGYDSMAILEKVKEARLKVSRGEARYERDSVTFNDIHIFWPLLASFLWISLREKGVLNVIDFGGSLGSTFFQNKDFLKDTRLSWHIIEQSHFVECGKKYFTTPNLSFHTREEMDILAQFTPVTFLVSSVLQYLEKPYVLLEKIKELKPSYLIFDRTTFLKGSEKDFPDRITIQQAHPKVYTATTFPAWFFNKQKLISYLTDHYEMVAEWPSIGDPIPLSDTIGKNGGMLFVHK